MKKKKPALPPFAAKQEQETKKEEGKNKWLLQK